MIQNLSFSSKILKNRYLIKKFNKFMILILKQENLAGTLMLMIKLKSQISSMEVTIANK